MIVTSRLIVPSRTLCVLLEGHYISKYHRVPAPTVHIPAHCRWGRCQLHELCITQYSVRNQPPHSWTGAAPDTLIQDIKPPDPTSFEVEVAPRRRACHRICRQRSGWIKKIIWEQKSRFGANVHQRGCIWVHIQLGWTPHIHKDNEMFIKKPGVKSAYCRCISSRRSRGKNLPDIWCPTRLEKLFLQSCNSVVRHTVNQMAIWVFPLKPFWVCTERFYVTNQSGCF